MKFYCSLCRVGIKYKTPRGWIDHVRGTKHKERRATILKPQTYKEIEEMRRQRLITKEECTEIKEAIRETESLTEIKSKVISILENSLIKIAQNILK
ncbi:hypothetical protein NEAUS03_1363 [Nematocida ausubeli]|nr:hypothetical protein NEAUS03_1363 [Nematocida ausubeli]